MISIITPTLNCAETIQATLVSISSLIKAGGEHIVVDSGSQDGTVEICRSSGARVVYCPAGNMYAAINFGMRLARHDLITYLNGDDIVFADPVLAELKRSGGSFDIAYGDVDYIDHCGRFLHCWRSPPPSRLGLIFAAGANALPQQGTILTKQLYHELAGFREKFRYAADFDLFLRAFASGARFRKYGIGSVAAFRIHSGQLSAKYSCTMAKESMNVSIGSGIRGHLLCRLVGMALFRANNIDTHWIRFLRWRYLTGQTRLRRTLDSGSIGEIHA